jgi:large subunit ribosomal protein L24
MKKTKHHIKIGDKVKVIAGNQKGFIGTISTLIKKKSVIILDGILPRIKFLKNNQSTEGKKKEIPIFIHSSNVMLWDVGNNQSSRIGYQLIDGKKKRYFKKSKTFVLN